MPALPVFVCCYRHQLNDPCDTVQQELDMTEQPAAQLWRYDINMTDGTHRQRCLAERHFEFPSVPPALLGQLQTSPLHHHVYQDCDSCCLRAQLYSPTCPVSFSSLAAQQLFVLLVVSVCANCCVIGCATCCVSSLCQWLCHLLCEWLCQLLRELTAIRLQLWSISLLPQRSHAWRHSQHDFVRRVLHVVLYQDGRGSHVAVSGRCVCCEWMSQRSSLLL